MAPTTQLIPQLGPDGIAMDPPVIAYSEKVLEEKELDLKRYIEENYSKIRNVERELASLAFEIKLTAGPKKAALEHLRKKVELSAEKIKVAKQSEEQANKIWEAAAKALKAEEENKQQLCKDLNRLVQESAASQYSRLEELKKKLDALNPEMAGGASVLNGKKFLPVRIDSKELLQQPAKENSNSKTDSLDKNNKGNDGSEASRLVAGISARPVTPDKEKQSSAQQGSLFESRVRSSTSRPPRGRSSHVVKAPLAQKTRGNSWTGAGFDVDDGSEAWREYGGAYSV